MSGQRVRVNLCATCAERLRKLEEKEGPEAFKARIEGKRGVGLLGLLCKSCIENAQPESGPPS